MRIAEYLPNYPLRPGRPDMKNWTLAFPFVLAASFGMAGCNEHNCPRSPFYWESNYLSTDEMEEIWDYYQSFYDLCRFEGCGIVPVGIDERNGLPVYIWPLCSDMCTCDVNRIFLVYSPRYTSEEECRRIGGCRIIMLGDVILCAPVSGEWADCN